MKEIDGVKYVTEEDFDNAVTSLIEDFFDFANKDDDTDKSKLAVTTMMMVAEFAMLGTVLFDKEETEPKKRAKKKTNKGGN